MDLYLKQKPFDDLKFEFYLKKNRKIKSLDFVDDIFLNMEEFEFIIHQLRIMQGKIEITFKRKKVKKTR